MKKKSPSASSAKVALTDEEKQVALHELGVSPAALVAKGAPTWAYVVGGGMVLAALLLSARLVSR